MSGRYVVKRARPLRLASVTAALLLSAALTAPARAQAELPPPAPDSAAAPEVEPLFTTSDLWWAGGFVAGTVILAPLDVAVAEGIQDSVLQVNRLLRTSANVTELLGFPGSVVIGGGLYAVGRITDRPALAHAGLHTTEAIVLATGVVVVGKTLLGRSRPRLDTRDPFNFAFGRGFTGDDYQSFPSGHTAAAFATAAALTTEISEHRPGARVVAGTLLFGGATLIAASRLYENHHWASDAMMGAAIGSFAGWKMVRWAHANPDNRLDRWLLPDAVAPGADGAVVFLWTLPTRL
jgi:membrane-associated phospholipid phosphatase